MEFGEMDEVRVRTYGGAIGTIEKVIYEMVDGKETDNVYSSSFKAASSKLPPTVTLAVFLPFLPVAVTIKSSGTIEDDDSITPYKVYILYIILY